MASGQKDYWRNVTPSKTIFSGAQTPFFNEHSQTLASGVNADLVDYTVPEGYILHLTSCIVTCSMPGVNRAILVFGTTYRRFAFFDTVFCFPFADGGGYPINGLDRMWLNITNNDTVSVEFFVSVVGFLQELNT